MPTDSKSMCSNTLFLSKNMDAGSSLRWLSASTMTLWHHFDSISDPEPQNLSQVVWIPVCVWGCYHMPTDSISMCSNTLYMSNVNAGSYLRWLSASTMTKSHHFDYTSDPEPQNLSPVVWVKLSKAPTVCPWTAYQCAQTHCMSSVDMGSCLRLLSASSIM